MAEIKTEYEIENGKLIALEQIAQTFKGIEMTLDGIHVTLDTMSEAILTTLDHMNEHLTEIADSVDQVDTWLEDLTVKQQALQDLLAKRLPYRGG